MRLFNKLALKFLIFSSLFIILVYVLVVNINSFETSYSMDTLYGDRKELGDVVFKGTRVNSTHNVNEIQVTKNFISVNKNPKYDAIRNANRTILDNKEIFRGKYNLNNIYETSKYLVYVNEQYEESQILNVTVKNKESNISVVIPILPPRVENLTSSIFGGLTIYNDIAVMTMIGKGTKEGMDLPVDSVLAVHFISLDKGVVIKKELFSLMTKEKHIGFKLPFNYRYSSTTNNGTMIIPLYPFLYSDNEKDIQNGVGDIKQKILVYSFLTQNFEDLDASQDILIDDASFIIYPEDITKRVSYIVSNTEVYGIDMKTGLISSNVILKRYSKEESYFKFIDKALIHDNKIYVVQQAQNDIGYEMRLIVNSMETGKLLFEGVLSSSDQATDLWFQNTKNLRDLRLEVGIGSDAT